MRKSLETISLVVLAVMAWMTWQALFGPNHLQERIPTNFGFSGQPNDWGSPSFLIALPAVAAGIYLLLTITARFPKAFNYPVEVTAENRPRLEALTKDLIAWLKMEMICLFAWVEWTIINAAREGHGAPSLALLPVFIGALFGIIAWYFVAMRRVAHTGPESKFPG